MQSLAREHEQKVLMEQEMLRLELEGKKKKLDSWGRELDKREALIQIEKQKLDEEKLDSWGKELDKREALIEIEKQKLDEERKQNDVRKSALQMASVEQRKADENVLRLVEEQKREKEAALKKILELERDIDAIQKLDMEITDLKGKLEVMKHLGGNDDAAVQNKIKEVNEELNDKMDERDGMVLWSP